MDLSNHTIPLIQWSVVIIASLAAAIFDLRTRRIPNLLTGSLMITGLMTALWVGGPAGLLDAIGGSILLAFPFVLLFVFADGGAGDAKLLGASGAWLGLHNSVIVLVAVSVSGIILAFGFALAKKRLAAVLTNLVRAAYHANALIVSRGRMTSSPSLMPRTEDMQTMPYGISILVGVCIAAGGVVIWHA